MLGALRRFANSRRFADGESTVLMPFWMTEQHSLDELNQATIKRAAKLGHNRQLWYVAENEN